MSNPTSPSARASSGGSIFRERLEMAVAEGGGLVARLAEAVGVSPRGFRRWRSGRRTPSVDHLRSLALAANRPADWLLGLGWCPDCERVWDAERGHVCPAGQADQLVPSPVAPGP